MKEFAEPYSLLTYTTFEKNRATLPQKHKTILLEMLKEGESPAGLLKRLNKKYKIGLEFLQELAEKAALEGLFSTVECINFINPEAIINGSIAQKLLSCPHGDEIEKLKIGSFFNLNTTLYFNSPTGSLIARILLAAKEEKNKKLKKESKRQIILNGENESDEVEKLMYILSKLPDCKPFEIYFVLTNSHWTTFGFKKDEKGFAELLNIDSQGDAFHFSIEDDFLQLSPEIEIYISLIKRQHVGGCCKAFSIDDLFHASNYKDPMYKDIFEYARTHIKKAVPLIKENFVLIPLSFLRTKQCLNTQKKDRTIYENGLYGVIESNLYSYEEKTVLPVNKKGQTFWESLDTHIVSDKNERLNDKLQKMKMLLLDYLLSNHWETIMEAKEKFTVDGLNSDVFGTDHTPKNTN